MGRMSAETATATETITGAGGVSLTNCHGFVENTWRKEVCSNCFRVRDEHQLNSVKSNGYLNNGLLILNNGNNIAANMNLGNFSTATATATSSNNNNRLAAAPGGRYLNCINSNGSTSQQPLANHFKNDQNGSSSKSISSAAAMIESHRRYQAQSTLLSSPNTANNSSNSCNSSSALQKMGKYHLNGDSNYSPNAGNYSTSPSSYSTSLSNYSTSSSSNQNCTNGYKSIMRNGSGGGYISNGHPSKSDSSFLRNGIPSSHSSSPVNTNGYANPGPISTTSGTKPCLNTLKPDSNANSRSNGGYNNPYTNGSGSGTGTSVLTNNHSMTKPSASGNSNSTMSSGPMNVTMNNASRMVNTNHTTATATATTTTNGKESTAPNNITYLNHQQKISNTLKTPNSSSSGSSLGGSSQQYGIGNGSGILGIGTNSYSKYNGTTTKDGTSCLKNGSEASTLLQQVVQKSGGGLANGSGSSSVTSHNKGALAGGKGVSCNQSRSGCDPCDTYSGGGNGGRIMEGKDTKPKFNVGGAMRTITTGRGAGSKGILKSKDKASKRRMNVSFPEEVVRVIGYSGEQKEVESDSEDETDSTPTDPQDSSSISDILDKNSTSIDEKEFHKLTLKNTNFNSIKTNLLGTTNIELGPIVGLTGGKSMENPSKPLVSIGTFDSRKEPLKIRKKLDEDSVEDEFSEKFVESNRKFVPRAGNNSNNPPLEKSVSNSNISQSKAPPKPLPTSVSLSNLSSKVNQASMSSATTATTTSNITSNASKSSTTTFSMSSYASSGSSSSTSNSSTNSKTTTPPSSSGKETTEPKSSGKDQSSSGDLGTNSTHLAKSSDIFTARGKITVESGKSQAKELQGLPTKSSDKNNANQESQLKPKVVEVGKVTPPAVKAGESNANGRTGTLNGFIQDKSLRGIKPISSIKAELSSNALGGNRVPKSILTSTTTTSINESFRPKSILKHHNYPPAVETLNGKESRNGDALNNLYILTEGNSIASKRTSFLRDIIAPRETVEVMSSDIHGVTIVTGITGSQVRSLESLGQSLEKDSLDEEKVVLKTAKFDLKIDLKTDSEVSPLPFGKDEDLAKTGILPGGDDSEFDDSLEDSGLDIGKTRTSESDEKSGSSSDSGNENDFSDRDNSNKTNTGTNTSSSNKKVAPSIVPLTAVINVNPSKDEDDSKDLFISVDEDEDEVDEKKPAKLSPDSVLFSSASEMSASGSVESIPEVCQLIGITPTATTTTTKNPTLSNAQPSNKRPAPLPPKTVGGGGSLEDISNEDITTTEDIYANQEVLLLNQRNVLDAPDADSDVEQEGEEEDVYDDVSNYKKSTSEEIEEEVEESIYDDCSILAAKNNGQGSGGGTQGSYCFNQGSGLDGGMMEEDDEIIARRIDGIEFKGIRKIDSETFLRERSPSPQRYGVSKRERSSSQSPKTRRKVNQFFSTIGKKAGAAFSNSHLASYGRTKSPGICTSPTGGGGDCGDYSKRSMSSDEVSASRTQELYATITPTSMKFKGLAPALQKLSKMDFTMNDKNKVGDGEDGGYNKKNKISSSIKKFLRFGSKDGSSSDPFSKYDFGSSNSSSNSHLYSGKATPTHNMVISAPVLQHQGGCSSSADELSSTPSSLSTTTGSGGGEDGGNFTTEKKDSAHQGAVPYRKLSPPGVKPPPPPPRVHSLDLLNKAGVSGPTGTVPMKPVRPPPPVRNNKVAPSFTSVFANPNIPVDSSGSCGSGSGTADSAIEIMAPPHKPRRKNSVNHHGQSRERDMESTYKQITCLNLETLQIIANQPLTKIARTSPIPYVDSTRILKWSDFSFRDLGQNESTMLIQGPGFVCHQSQVEGQDCTLLVQESSLSKPTPFQFSCVESDITFEDVVPYSFVPWEPLDEAVKTERGMRAILTVLPLLGIWKVEDFIKSADVPLDQKYLALLQTLDHWGFEDLSNLLILKPLDLEPQAIRPRSSIHSLDLNSTLVYIHKVSSSQGDRRSSIDLINDFEVSMKQLLLTSDEEGSTAGAPILTENDRQVLLQRVSGSWEQVRAQLKLFFQLKLFVATGSSYNEGPRDSDEVRRIKQERTEQAINQWLDKERAICMKVAVERSIRRSSFDAESITPFKKGLLEFLMKPGNSAKAILEMFVELFE